MKFPKISFPKSSREHSNSGKTDIKKYLQKNRIEIIIVLSLFFISLGFRTMPVDRFSNIYGFDSYWGSRMTKYFIMDGYVWPIDDLTTDYPWGRLDSYPSELGWWSINAFIYKVAEPFAGTTTPDPLTGQVIVNGFDYGLFGTIASWMVAITGALAIPAIYLFGKEAFNRVTGLASALFLMTSSSHLFYSMFGHAENDGFGFSLFFICLFLFVITIKKRNWKYGVLTAISFSWVSVTWQSYEKALVPLVGVTTIIFFIIYAVMKKFNYYQESEERKQMRKWIIFALLFTLVSGFFAQIIVPNIPRGVVGIGTIGAAILIASLIEFFMLKKEIYKKIVIGSTAMLAVMLLIFGTILITAPLQNMGVPIGPSYDNPLPYEVRMVSTIAEQNPVPGDNFFGRLNALSGNFGIAIWLAFMAAIFILAKLMIMPFIRKDFNYYWDIAAVFFILISLESLTSKAISMFFLSGAIAFGAGYFFGFVWRFFQFLEEKSPILKNYYLPTATLLVTFSIGSGFIITGLPAAESFGYDLPMEWFNTFDWMNNNLAQDSVITAWWDYGHWMNYYNGDKIHTSLDNIQDRKDIIYTVASAFTHTTPCRVEQQTFICETSEEALETAELESLSLLKQIGTTHILVDKEIIGGSTGGKFGALAHIADVQVGCFQVFGCVEDSNGMVQCPVGNVNTNDGVKSAGYLFTPEQWQTSVDAKWPASANALPLVVYDDSMIAGTVNTRYFAKNALGGGKEIYGSAISCGGSFFDMGGGRPGAEPNSPILYTFMHRLFFRDPNLKHVTLVYDDGWNVIYEVDWTNVPDSATYTDWTNSRSVLCTGEAAEACRRSEERGYA